MAEKKGKVKVSSKSAGEKEAKKTSGPKVAPKSTKKKTTFKLQAPDASKVFVAGCFNNWDPTANPLKRGKEGVWTCTLLLELGEHEYRFVVDEVWWNDPVNLLRRQTEFGCENCILVV